MAKSITYRGVEYKTITAACKALGVPYPRTMQRMKSGFSFDEAVSISERLGRQVVVLGVKYASLEIATRTLGVSDASVRTYAKDKNVSIEEALEFYALGNTRQPFIKVTVRGVEYESVADFARAIGVHRDAATLRVYRKKYPGMSDSELCELWLSKKEANEARALASKAKAAERKANAIAKAEAAKNKLVQGEYTPLKICPACCKFYQPVSVNFSTWFTANPIKSSIGICSNYCRAKLKRKQSKKTRKARRAEGKETKYRLAKRAKKVGARIDLGITAAKVAKRDGFKCQLCGDRVEKHLGKGWQPKGWSVGHIVPNAMGGHLTWDNVWCECCECNSHKGDRVLDRWAFKKRAETDQLSFIEELDQSMAAWRATTPTASRPSPCQ